jgi:hypothetical protein
LIGIGIAIAIGTRLLNYRFPTATAIAMPKLLSFVLREKKKGKELLPFPLG